MRQQKPLIDAVLQEKQSLLIVLDACNYDYFVRWVKSRKPALSKVVAPVQSSGTRTLTWIVNTFEGKHYDATYISGNPFVNTMGVTEGGQVAVKAFTRIVDAWRDWDEEKGTCLAETVNSHAVLNLSEPRLVVHYLQPHQPYVGETSIPDNMYYRSAWYKIPLKYKPPPIRQIDGNTTRYFTEEQKNAVRKAYYSNMEYVCDAMVELVKKRRGVIAITADHSELMGENGRWFHWGGHQELRRVPWISFVR